MWISIYWIYLFVTRKFVVVFIMKSNDNFFWRCWTTLCTMGKGFFSILLLKCTWIWWRQKGSQQSISNKPISLDGAWKWWVCYFRKLQWSWKLLEFKFECHSSCVSFCTPIWLLMTLTMIPRCDVAKCAGIRSREWKEFTWMTLCCLKVAVTSF